MWNSYDEDIYTVSVNTLINNNYDFGLKDYPIHKEEFRPILNELFLEHFRFKEIAFNNVAVWRNRLNLRFNILMRDRYKMLFEKKELEFNPLYNIEIHETFRNTVDDKGKEVNNINQNNETNNTSKVTNKDNIVNKNVDNGETNISESGENGKEGNNKNVTNYTDSNTLESNVSENGTNTATESSNGVNDSKSINYIYPTSKMNEGDFTKDIYASNGAKNDSSSESTTNTSNTNNKTSNTENTNTSEGNNTTDFTIKEKNTNSMTNNTTYNNVNDLTSNRQGESNTENSTNSNMISNINKDITNKRIEEYTKLTEGSSAGLPFSKAMLQFKEYVEEFSLLSEFFSQFNDLFINVW